MLFERLIRPGPEVEDDAAQLDDARRTRQTCWHPASTCRMGPPGDGVVDERCRVRCMAGLRAVDASAFPVMPATNTHVPRLMLAEKAAGLILADRPA